MLTELTIKNFAIIDHLQIEFGPGLNALTGETGAGKSILVDAIGLILGGKASVEMIRTGAEETSIEAFFDLSTGEVAQALHRFDLEKNEGLVIRRLITRSGKSRAFLNGNAVTLGMLEEISGELVNIYGQHEHQHFLEPKRHIDILDGAGDLLSRRRSYEELYGQWRQAAGELEDWTRRQQQRRERMELLAFQSQEISRACLQEPRPGEPNEEETLTAERARLVHAEKLFEIAHQGFETLYGESGSVIERLKGTRQRLREGEKIDSSLSPFRQALETAVLQVEDAASSLRSYRDKIHFDPMRLEEIESRLDEIRKLKRKYGGSLEEVLAYKKKLDEERKSLETLEEKIAETQTRVDHFYRQALQSARELSQQRKKIARNLDAKVEAELADLGMGKARFQIRLEGESPHPEGPASPPFGETGLDRVEFFLSPNPGEDLKPLAKIASGGELSRIMLALKRIFTQDSRVRTMIFDEVDAGIGGAIAEVVGRKLKDIARRHQVFCITHLAQIASYADVHYKVAKMAQRERTVVEVERLKEEGRIKEIARMLGGVKITGKTLEHAGEMLRSAAGKK
ncbi:MAG: repair protein recN [Deltaproteobacteria bacterium]|nr:repair protein recN [Deltaproteobacteria bacterium]